MVALFMQPTIKVVDMNPKIMAPGSCRDKILMSSL